MTKPEATYHSAPGLAVEDCHLGVQVRSLTGGLTLTLGSDLVLCVNPDDSGGYTVGVCDSDANHLTTLAVVQDAALAPVAATIPIAAEAAVRLYPNHLLTPL
jgi:hypothetical protein